MNLVSFFVPCITFKLYEIIWIGWNFVQIMLFLPGHADWSKLIAEQHGNPGGICIEDAENRQTENVAYSLEEIPKSHEICLKNILVVNKFSGLLIPLLIQV